MNNSKKSILIFIDFDVAVRHFVKNGTFAALERKYGVSYVFNDDKTSEKKGVHADIYNLGLKRILLTNVPKKRTGFWYFLYAATVLRQQHGLKNFEARRRQLLEILGKRNLTILEWIGTPLVYHMFRSLLMSWLGVDNSVRKLIETEKPDLIIHPSTLNGYYVNELLPECRKTGIPLVLLMNSWDNPSAKAVCTGIPDKLVVWGEQSRQQAIQYMRMPADRIECFGAAQFQVYRTPPTETPAQLREMFGVPKGKKLLLYAGAGNGRHETQYLRLLEVGIRNGILPDCHVIYRPHPWRGELAIGEEDFFSIDWGHITMDPSMADYYRRETKNSDGIIFMADYNITNKLLTLIDAVISPLSTMLIEALIKGKPVLAFFPEREHGVIFGIDEVHFSDFLKIPEVNVCLEEKAFYPACQKLIDQTSDQSLGTRLRNHAEFYAVMDGPTYAERLKKLVDDILPTCDGVKERAN